MKLKKTIIIFVSSFLIGGCQSINESLFGKSLVIQMHIKTTSNNNNAFENEIVASTSSELTKKIEHATNKEWFDEGLIEFQALKKSNSVKVYKTYIVPAEARKSVTVNIPKECKTIYIFNRYNSQINSYPIKVSSDKNLKLIFENLHIDYKEIAPQKNELETKVKDE